MLNLREALVDAQLEAVAHGIVPRVAYLGPVKWKEWLAERAEMEKFLSTKIVKGPFEHGDLYNGMAIRRQSEPGMTIAEN